MKDNGNQVSGKPNLPVVSQKAEVYILTHKIQDVVRIMLLCKHCIPYSHGEGYVKPKNISAVSTSNYVCDALPSHSQSTTDASTH